EQAARDREVLLQVLDDEQFAQAALPSVAASRLAFLAAQMRARSSSPRWQRKRCSTPTGEGRSSGSSVRQRSNTYGQRGLNAHPCGGWSREGGCPGICSSRSDVTSRRGSEPSSPHVYGISGLSKRLSTLACSTTRPPYMTSTSLASSATT